VLVLEGEDSMENTPKTTGVNQDDKLMGAFSYVWILSLIILITKKDSEFVKFHARQGFVLFIASVVLGFIPILNWVVWLVVTVAAIYGIYNAMNGQKKELPLIGQFAKKINI